MDPNKALAELRKWAALVFRTGANPELPELSQSDAEDAASYFQSLDHWLTNGGFLPKQWESEKNS